LEGPVKYKAEPYISLDHETTRPP